MKKAIVVGGSQGLGLGVAQALATAGAHVTVVARRDFAEGEHPQLQLAKGDGTDRALADRVIGSIMPDVTVVAAGAPPHMEPINSIGWEAFSNTWNADVRISLTWIQAALAAPLKAGSLVLLVSSGAAINGSPFSGGYGGAKRMIWLMADYAQKWADRQKLDITFQTIVPRQMFANTGTGDAGSISYSRDVGISQEQFLQGFGKQMTPAEFGEHVVRIIEDDALRTKRAFAINGDTGAVAVEIDVK